MTIRPWKITSSVRDSSYRVFSLRKDRAVSPRTGKEHSFFVLESSSWVNVIPLTDRDEVVMVRQYRHGIQDVTLEIPGGLVEAGDSPEEAAAREFHEETGYRCMAMTPLGTVHPNPAIQNNACYSYLARGAYPVGEQEQDDKEDIEVVLRPLADIPRLIREGEITHSLVIVAFYRFYMEYRERSFKYRVTSD